jgi:mannan endo-1,4-beta-mannosidase
VRAKRRESPFRVLGSLVALAGIAVAFVFFGAHDEQAGDAAARVELAAVAPATSTLSVGSVPLLGAYIPDTSAAAFTGFEKLTGTDLQVAMYNSWWGRPFLTTFAEGVYQAHATPLVQMTPGKTALRAIADGSQDTYLMEYAAAVRTYREPVIISFGAEFNVNWFPWGYTHASPASFVAAWRHIVSVFRRAGADNVTWLWNADAVAGQAVNPRPWWPGSGYVTWTGLDGYYSRPGDTFASLFSRSLRDLRAFDGKPVFIAETAVAATADRGTQIANLFASVKADKLAGFAWFDSPGAEDWRIDDSPSAVAEFGAAAKRYGYGS